MVKSDADPSIILGARRGIINGLAVAGAGEPALYKVQAKKFGYRVMEPSTISLRAGECTSVSVHLASCLAKEFGEPRFTKAVWWRRNCPSRVLGRSPGGALRREMVNVQYRWTRASRAS